MSVQIVITKDAINVHRFEDDSIEQILEPIEDETSLTHLREICKIADNVTLGDIFSHVEKLPLLKLFISQYSWCSAIDEFHEQAKLPRVEHGSENNRIDYIEISHSIESTQLIQRITHPGGHRERLRTVNYDHSPDLHGVGVMNKHMDGGLPVSFSMSLSPMNSIAHLPVKINQTFKVYEPFDPKRHNSAERPQLLIEDDRPFSFLEVLDAIYWDISFYGGPQQIADFTAEQIDTVEKIKSGEIKTIPFEEAFKDVVGTGEVPYDEALGMTWSKSCMIQKPSGDV